MMFNTRTYAFCFGLLALAFHPLASIAQSSSNAFDLIPYPQTLEPGEGNFIVTAQTKITSAPRFSREAVQLTWILQQGLGSSLPPLSTRRPAPVLPLVSTRPQANDTAGPDISLEYDANVTLPEAYVLIIDSRHVILRAREAAGIFHGIETIRQLLPAAAEKGTIGDRLLLPAVRIEDHPAYAWRGMHLDVARHFFSLAYLRKMIDRMALYKMNRLHLHLTDDQGWRIEIKKYPLLTQAGAWRSFNNQDSDCMRKAADDPDFAIDKSHIIKRNGHLFYGGFYTQQEMRELVAFAAARHIEIIPEIDMPGHMMAAINSYPFLTCNGQNTWGELFTRPICPCNESTFEFAENVFSEIMDIFPSRYIHIGGDEVDRSDWAKSPACKAVMQREGINDLPALQSYFIGHMEKFFLSKGRKLVGWDEIIEGPISSTALVMYWRSWVKGAPLKAAQNGNEIVMATGEPLYFDRPADQSDLSNIYHFIPVPGNFDSLQAKLIIGAQACLWSEQLPSEKRADYMYMPRMTALAEALWTGRPERYDSYLQRMPGHYARMDAMKINYRLPDLPGLLNNYMFTQEYALRIPAPVRNMTIRYTRNGRRPLPGSPELPAPLIIRKNTLLRVAAFSPSGCHGDIYELNFTQQPMLTALTDIQPDNLHPGLACSYYKASFKSTKPMAGAKADSLFTYFRIAVPATVQAPAFGITYRGYIDVPEDGTYSFYLTCDDGGVLQIGSAVTIDNDGNHSARVRSGQAILQKGLHPFKLDFIEGGGGFTLRLCYSFNGSPLWEIPRKWFRH